MGVGHAFLAQHLKGRPRWNLPPSGPSYWLLISLTARNGLYLFSWQFLLRDETYLLYYVNSICSNVRQWFPNSGSEWNGSMHWPRKAIISVHLNKSFFPCLTWHIYVHILKRCIYISPFYYWCFFWDIKITMYYLSPVR